MIEALARGVVALWRTSDNKKTLLVPLLDEGNKSEMVVGYDHDFQPLVDGMWETVSGAVDIGDEDLQSALHREIEEERRIAEVQISKKLPQELQVIQQRELREVSFLVSMFFATLTPHQQCDLRSRYGVMEIGDDYLRSNISDLDFRIIRPLTRAALQLMAHNNLWETS